MKPQAIYWFRRDFRLDDNPALQETLKFPSCLFIAEPIWDNPHQNQLFHQGVHDLNSELSRSGQQIFVLSEPLIPFLKKLRLRSHHPLTLLFTKSQNWRDQQIEEDVMLACRELNIETQSLEASRLFNPTDLPWSVESFPSTFTTFRKDIEKRHLVPLEPAAKSSALPQRSPLEASAVELTTGMASSKLPSYFRGGPGEAKSRLDHYFWKTQKILSYKETRNGLLDFDDSSKLSPYLALGHTSARLVYKELKDFEHSVIANESTYWLYFELLWREYFKCYSEVFGKKLFMLSGPQEKTKPANQDKELWLRWTKGETEEPFVNAHMNELMTWGWMSNRGRQNVASYLAKTLKVEWRWGAEWFAQKLIDYDVEVNWGNWAYLAGVGADPRDRVFNVQHQAKVYDPHNLYTSKFTQNK